jgi:TolB protein
MKTILLASVLLALPMVAWSQGQAQSGEPGTGLNSTLTLTPGQKGGIKIAIVPFAWESAAMPPTQDQDVARVIRADMNRSGKFVALRDDLYSQLPKTSAEVDYGFWKDAAQQYVVVGRISDNPDGTFRISYELLKTATQERLLGFSEMARAGDLRRPAHRIADAIYEKILGVRGAFDTQVAYVTSTGVGRDIVYRLWVAHADGFNPIAIAKNNEPFMSPTWSPDGKRIAYVSFERLSNRSEPGRSSIIIQEIASGVRKAYASFRGINGAPAFSPDGGRLALTLSRGGNPEINVLDFASGKFTQLTRHYSIDTEPQFSPDGSQIFFTSDRGGKPQIYRMPSSGGDAVRVSFQGEYNARVSVSFDGNLLAMVQGNGNIYRIAAIDRSRGEPGLTRVLTNGRLDESPSLSPNAGMVLYAAREGTRGVLYAAAVEGTLNKQRLASSEGDVREPAWGPFRPR